MPIKLFDISWQPPVILKPGDVIKLVPVSEKELRELRSLSKLAYKLEPEDVRE